MPGIEKTFDYAVPDVLHARVHVGSVVRVILNHRTVDGWVVATGALGEPGFDEVAAGQLLDLQSVADLGVDPVVCVMSEWIAEKWSGPRRAVLRSATPVRKRARHANPAHGSAAPSTDPVAEVAASLLVAGGGVLMVPPLASALSAVVEATTTGTVLVVCPTQRMAVLGAAYLRRRGLTTALLPDDIDAAVAGVDVVLGARSAVLAPCHGLGCVVVIDEHEDSLWEERVPTWWAGAIAAERARRSGIPVLFTSPAPSAWAELILGRAVVAAPGGWPAIDIVDLHDVPMNGSLLSSQLLSTVRDGSGAVLCVLNTKGTARLLACRGCRSLQTCGACGSSTSLDGGQLVCSRCGATSEAVCGSCGSLLLVNVRAGTTRLAAELTSATGVDVREVTADTVDIGGTGGAWVGTDALLQRVRDAATVVFLDIDRDLAAPRSSAPRDVLSMLCRAARAVGSGGRVVVQTRQPDHPLLVALSNGTLREWLDEDTLTRGRLGLRPFAAFAVCTFSDAPDRAEIPQRDGVEWSLKESTLTVRSASHETLLGYLDSLRETHGSRVRVSVNPPRL